MELFDVVVVDAALSSLSWRSCHLEHVSGSIRTTSSATSTCLYGILPNTLYACGLSFTPRSKQVRLRLLHTLFYARKSIFFSIWFGRYFGCRRAAADMRGSGRQWRQDVANICSSRNAPACRSRWATNQNVAVGRWARPWSRWPLPPRPLCDVSVTMNLSECFATDTWVPRRRSGRS